MDLIRLLLSLAVCVNLLPLVCLSFNYAAGISFEYGEIEDQIALMQLREILLLAYDLEVYDDELVFIYQNKDFSIRQVGGRLLLQPGTQIFLDEADGIGFSKEGGIVYLHYEKNERDYRTPLCSEEGIRLDRFSDCTDPDIGDSQGQE